VIARDSNSADPRYLGKTLPLLTPSALATITVGQRSRYRGQKDGRKVSMDVLRIIIAILLPPLGVFLQVGIGKHF
jgi:hypothetical protein